MKQRIGPGVIVIGAIVLIGFLFFMYRRSFPPSRPNDTDNPKSMPSYAKMAEDYIKSHPNGGPPAGMPGAPGAGGPAAGAGSPGGGATH